MNINVKFLLKISTEIFVFQSIHIIRTKDNILMAVFRCNRKILVLTEMKVKHTFDQ